MSEQFDTIIRGGTCVNQDGRRLADIGISDGRIAEIGPIDASRGGEVIDATGLMVLPGVIDTQVHFREPGLDHKEDLETGGRAAVKGGVTAVFEMPNTKPNTTTVEAVADKVRRGTNRMYCDFAFYAGATTENVDTLAELEMLPGVCGIKMFMGSSTGNLLVAEDDAVEAVLRNGKRRMAVHSEDEFRLLERREEAKVGEVATHAVWRDAQTAIQCTERLLHLARRTNRQVHVLHISTADEMHILKHHKDIASVEVTPQHLTLAAPDCYERLGSYAQQNPPLRDASHREGIWWGLNQGIVDVLGTDHAPHLREEKDKTYPTSPSGMPGVQTFLPIMLDHVNAGRLTLERFVDLTSHGPNRLFGIARKGRIAVGYDADFTIVDLKAKRTITNESQESKCGWTPFDGVEVTGWPIGTIIRGTRVMWEDEILGLAQGQPMQFHETLSS